MQIDLSEFITQFQDYLAPKLDMYEHAIYLYIFRHSRLLGLDEVTIGFKSARLQLPMGVGEAGKFVAERTAYVKLESLRKKGCIQILSTNHKGRVLRLLLPKEIAGVVTLPIAETIETLENMDFFDVPENRLLLLERERFKCFYTLQKLTALNFVVEHVVSRPEGDNSYRNCVAACREANNKKGARSADDFLRSLFREGYLSSIEFDERLNALSELKAGSLKPLLGARQPIVNIVETEDTQ